MNINFYKKIFQDSNEKIDKKFYQEFIAKQLILRDYLAIERTILTNEATFLGYIRTSLTVAVVGVSLLNLYPENETLQYIGLFLSAIAFFTFVTGSIRSMRMSKKINKFLNNRKEVEETIDK